MIYEDNNKNHKHCKQDAQFGIYGPLINIKCCQSRFTRPVLLMFINKHFQIMDQKLGRPNYEISALVLQEPWLGLALGLGLPGLSYKDRKSMERIARKKLSLLRM